MIDSTSPNVDAKLTVLPRVPYTRSTVNPDESTSFQAPPVNVGEHLLARFPEATTAKAPGPDNPPWGLPAALLTWLASVGFLLFVPLVVAVPYVVYRSLAKVPIRAESVIGDKTFIFLSIVGVIPAHILTLVVVWLVVTGARKRPFWQTLGWSWPENFGPWKAVGAAVGLLILSRLLTVLLGGGETQLDQLINSSYATRVATAFLAAATGPLVEELVYRGLIYSALRRLVGVVWAVVAVSLLFASVHVWQYYNNIGVIAVIAILSISLTLVRALTGRLLPCFMIHFVFNGIQSLYLVFGPLLERIHPSTGEQKAALFLIRLALQHAG